MVNLSSIVRPPYVSIVDWFDPENIEHLQAYAELQEKGCWPKEFWNGIPEKVKFQTGWGYMLAMKLADLYVKEKLSEK